MDKTVCLDAEKEKTLKMAQEDAIELLPKSRHSKLGNGVESVGGAASDSDDGSEVVYENTPM